MKFKVAYIGPQAEKHPDIVQNSNILGFSKVAESCVFRPGLITCLLPCLARIKPFLPCFVNVLVIEEMKSNT